MHVANFLQNLAGGGAERVAVLLMNGLVERHRISLILARREGPYLADLDPRIEVIDLGGKRTFGSVFPLRAWLRQHRPDVLVSHLTHVNVAAGIATMLCHNGTPHVAVEHNQMGLNFDRLDSGAVRLAYRGARFVYPRIDSVVGVSDGVCRSVKAFTGLDGSNFRTIHNPVVTPQLLNLAAEAPAHPWLAEKTIPVILGCGRLHEQKDFGTLIDAFRIIRAQRQARLLILGEGERRSELQALIDAHGLQDDIAMPGFDRNPFAAMRAADVFVLSSRWEGLPTVLIEALATGVNVVSTDCPSGPDEVLDNGNYGALVPVGDAAAIAAAVIARLDQPLPAAVMRERAMAYALDRAVANYESLFESLRSNRRA